MTIEINKESGEFEPRRENHSSETPPTVSKNYANISNIQSAMKKEDFMAHFNEILNKSPKELLSSLYCQVPDKMIADMTPDEKLEFIHFLDTAQKIQKVYCMSVKVQLDEEIESSDIETKKRIRAADEKYIVKPIEEVKKKTDQEKAIALLKKAGLSDDTIANMLKGK
jgi:hypothetical protein